MRKIGKGWGDYESNDFTRNVLSILHLAVQNDPPKIRQVKYYDFTDEEVRKVAFRAEAGVLDLLFQYHGVKAAYAGTWWRFEVWQHQQEDYDL